MNNMGGYNMKFAVLGAGLIGKEVAKDLMKCKEVEQVVLADVNLHKAEALCNPLNDSKLTAAYIDASNLEELAQFFQPFDVIINALLYTFNETVAKAAIKAGVHVCDLGGHIGEATDHVLQLFKEAEAAKVTIIPDLGVAPGMTNILAGYGASKLDQVETMLLRVGGIPVKPEPPLGYNHVFSMEGVFDHYTDPSLMIRNGKKTYVPSLSEVETIYFERFGPLEAFHTAGGTSTLSRTFPNLYHLEYKTIRYPGHAEKMKLLVDLNLTRRDHEVDVRGQKIKPREVLLKVLEPIVHLGDKDDVVLLKVIVKGIKDNKKTAYEYEMITYNDHRNRITAMARSTAYTVSVVGQMIAAGRIDKIGVFAPEEIVPGDKYIEEMAKREVYITEKIYR
jgi:lysine 6-dehydrogenase